MTPKSILGWTAFGAVGVGAVATGPVTMGLYAAGASVVALHNWLERKKPKGAKRSMAQTFVSQALAVPKQSPTLLEAYQRVPQYCLNLSKQG